MEKIDYKKEYIFSFWDDVRLWFLVRKVYRQKITSLWEANLDKLYFESQFREILSYDEKADREDLLAERKKNNPIPGKADELENRIAKAKAVKQSYRKNEDFIVDIKRYIKMLELFRQSKYGKS